MCVSDTECDLGERCVPAPVAGSYDDFFTSGCESCDYFQGQGECICTCYDDAVQRALCVSTAELPGTADCPADGLSCSALLQALQRFSEYGMNAEYGSSVLSRLDDCWWKFRSRWQAECGGGEGGAGGEGGGG